MAKLDSNDVEKMLNKYESELSADRLARGLQSSGKYAYKLSAVVEMRKRLRELVSAQFETVSE